MRELAREQLRGSASGPRAARRSQRWVLICWLMLVLGACSLWAGQAWGATGHQFLSSLAEAPPGTKLVQPAALAFDRSSGRLFVGDRLAGYVDVYGPTGEYETRFGAGAIEAAGIALDESSGDVYVAEPLNDAVLAYEPDGKGGYQLLAKWSGAAMPGKAFGEVTGVAVDNSEGPSSGDLYVLEAKGVGVEGGVVDVYRPKPNPAEGEGQEGEFLRRLSGAKLESPNGVAVSASSGPRARGRQRQGRDLRLQRRGGLRRKTDRQRLPQWELQGQGRTGQRRRPGRGRSLR